MVMMVGERREDESMYAKRIIRGINLTLIALMLGACAPSDDVPGTQSNLEATTDAALPLLVVYKSESCGCCSDWVTHMERAGFKTEVHNVDNLNPIKTEVGLPPMMGSCHTARVGKYFVEGHVPADDVKRLLAEQSDAKGLAVPRMPIGSPGMEVPSGEVEPYDVLLIANDGSASVFASHGKK
jgi:hypothetical protein